MPEKTDSKDGLGKSIADDFDNDEDENHADDEDNDGGDDKTGSRDTDNDGEDKDDSKDGKGKAGKDDEDDDDEKKVTLSESELRRMMSGAVNEAVAKTNSTKDRALERQRNESREERERLTREREEAQLNGLSDEDKARMREVHKNDRKERELDERDRDSAAMFRAGKIEQHLGSHARFGVTREDLEDCDSDAEMTAICSEKERDYWKTFAETGKAPDGAPDKSKGSKKREKPAGSTRRTDTGGDGTGSEGQGSKGPATNLSGFAKGLVEHGVVPTRGIERVGSKKQPS